MEIIDNLMFPVKSPENQELVPWSMMDRFQIDTVTHSIYMELDAIDGLHRFEGQLIQWHVMGLIDFKRIQFYILYTRNRMQLMDLLNWWYSWLEITLSLSIQLWLFMIYSIVKNIMCWESIQFDLQYWDYGFKNHL